MQKKIWDEVEDIMEINQDADLIAEEKYDDEGPLAGFEDAAEHAYDEDFLKEDANAADWFEE